MKFPLYRGLRWKRYVGGLCLFAVCCLVSSCVIEPLPSLLCYPCKKTCIEEQKLICVQGVCVPESNPDPKQCLDEQIEGGEKAEPTVEINPEESTNPEDGASTEREPFTETEPEKPEIPDTQNVIILQIEGDDDQAQPISYPSGTNPPADAKPAAFRFRTAWRIYGTNLQRIDTWLLQSKDKSQTFTLLASDRKDTEMKLTLPAALTAGFFTLIGLIGTTPTVQAETFVLQGKDGKDGAQGPKGDKGDKGDPGLTANEQSQLQALLPKVKASGSKLVITADEISFESTAGTEVGKITIDSAKKELTFSTGTTVFSLTSTQITASASQISLTTPTFEVKGTATNPTTSLTLDDTARSIALRVTQKNAAIQAAFSLEGGDANTSPAPATKYPLAIFNRTNIQVQSGEGSTTATLNGLGNLILGYNSKTKSTTALRTGSHNLIVGDDHDYQNYGGFVSGSQNILIGGFSTVAGGSGSTASGTNSTVAGGSGNEAGRDGSSICSSVNVKVRSTDPSAAPVRYCCGNAGP